MSFFSSLFRLFSKPATVSRKLTSPGFGFTVEVEGNDLVVRNTRATCFGGSDDPQDSGETASGVSTKRNPNLRAVSLPMNYQGPHGPTKRVLGGSPLPMLPWHTEVVVTCEGKTVIVEVIDLGPSKLAHNEEGRTGSGGNGIDFTIALARMFRPNATARNFSAMCSYRIPGGAKYLDA